VQQFITQPTTTAKSKVVSETQISQVPKKFPVPRKKIPEKEFSGSRSRHYGATVSALTIMALGTIQTLRQYFSIFRTFKPNVLNALKYCLENIRLHMYRE